MAVIGVDAGTTSCKAVLFNNYGDVLYSSHHEYQVYHPFANWAELKPDEVWNAVQLCIVDICKGSSEKVEAIAVSSQGEGMIALDKKGNPISNIIVSFDKRSILQSDYLKNELGEDLIYNTTGQIIGPMCTATKIMWLQQNRGSEEVIPSAYVCVGDYIVSRFGIEPVIDYSLAARTMLFDVTKKDWSSTILDLIGINKNQLSQIQPAGTPIGYINSDVASSLGLSKNVMIVAGGHDQPCAMLGTGATKKGVTTYSIGTTETLICSMDNFKVELKAYGLPCYPHVIEGQYVTLAGNFTGGNLLQWFKDQFAENEKLISEKQHCDVYELLMNCVPETPSGLYVLPHFTVTGSPWNDPQSTGMILGLQLGTTKGQFIRGLLEGVTSEILLNISILEKLGISISECIIVGGGTKSKKLLQLKSDVLGIPLKVLKISNSSSKGAAILAGKGIGLFKNLSDAWKEDKDSTRVFPQENLKEYYKKQFLTYQRIYPAVKSILE